MNLKIVSTLLVIILFSCKSEKEMTFSDFVEIQKIEKVIMSNNSGKFVLSPEQLVTFKTQISTLKYNPDISAKMGNIGMTLIIGNQEYYIGARTHGDLIEIDPDLVTKNKWRFNNPFFYTEGINFDNYKRTKIKSITNKELNTNLN